MQTIISKEAKVFAQELYDEMDIARKIKQKENEISDEECSRRYAETLSKNPNAYSHCLECGMVGGSCNPCKFEDEYTKTTTITRKFGVSKQ
jgi:succinate dehydrogenase/fumarate reductase-like Fe-S protein